MQNIAADSIESGYFVFTLMPSLFCKLRCPHCYLSLDERKDKTMLSPELIEETCLKIDAYWNEKGIRDRTVVCYWYGGEPTSMGIDTFKDMADRINRVFDPARGYQVKHIVLTSLVSVRDDWFDVFRTYGGGEFQTSYDGDMRGKSYMRKWESRVRASVEQGLKVSTITVVNQEILAQGAANTLDYLADLKIKETSWLPFMWNEQNASGAYEQYAPTMDRWSQFMQELTEHWMNRRLKGLETPTIGQMRFIMAQAERSGLANIAAQTLFLMPNGDFVLPDYDNGWKEFMRPFGNILTQSFNEVLTSPARRAYLRRQVLRNRNQECLGCEYQDRCVMEFWKENRNGDDCFGGKKYVTWLDQNAQRIRSVLGDKATTLLF
jgi:sulfatase maturation enzyme AslB (radical SAM superfamily)